MRSPLFTLLGWLGAMLLIAWRLTLRLRVHEDPRPAIREAGRRYVYAIPHAQQLNFVLLSDDRPVAAMISASKDGDILEPSCRVRSVIPVRGSTNKKGKDKGGRRAMREMFDTVKRGIPALLAVDGPRGPRGTVHWGVAKIAKECDAIVVVAGVFPVRRKVLTKTWDRTQIPLPFTTMHGRFGNVVDSRDFEDLAEFRTQIMAEMHALEQRWDPGEAAFTTVKPGDDPQPRRAPQAEAAAAQEAEAAPQASGELAPEAPAAPTES